MKTIITFLLFLPLSLIAQFAIDNSLLDKTLLTELPGGIGAGFLIQDNNNLYLVSSGYHLIDPDGVNDGKLTAKSFKSRTGIGMFAMIDHNGKYSNMAFLFNKLYQEGHVNYNKQKDIIVIRMGSLTGKENMDLLPVSGVEIKGSRGGARLDVIPLNIGETELFADSNLGSEIFLFTYPSTIGLPIYNHIYRDRRIPLLVKGSLAMKDDIEQMLIIDCPVNEYNIGSPVFEIKTDSKATLMGVLTQPLPQKGARKKETKNSESDYSIVVPMDDIIKMIKEMN